MVGEKRANGSREAGGMSWNSTFQGAMTMPCMVPCSIDNLGRERVVRSSFGARLRPDPKRSATIEANPARHFIISLWPKRFSSLSAWAILKNTFAATAPPEQLVGPLADRTPDAPPNLPPSHGDPNADELFHAQREPSPIMERSCSTTLLSSLAYSCISWPADAVSSAPAADFCVTCCI